MHALQARQSPVGGVQEAPLMFFTEMFLSLSSSSLPLSLKIKIFFFFKCLWDLSYNPFPFPPNHHDESNSPGRYGQKDLSHQLQVPKKWQATSISDPTQLWIAKANKFKALWPRNQKLLPPCSPNPQGTTLSQVQQDKNNGATGSSAYRAAVPRLRRCK